MLKIINEIFVIAIVNYRTWIHEADFLEAREKGKGKRLRKAGSFGLDIGQEKLGNEGLNENKIGKETRERKSHRDKEPAK